MTSVAIFPTCVVDAVSPEVGFATARVLTRRGCDVSVADKTTCCGQPAWNAGHVEPAAVVARTTLAGIEDALRGGAEAVVVPAGSCTTMIRVFWPELFAAVGQHDAAHRARAVAPKVFELSEYLQSCDESLNTVQRDNTTSIRYHPSCHMLRELGIKEQPCAALRGAGYEVDEGPERCCGFGGLFSVKLPETSIAMADAVLDAAVTDGATEVVGADGSCLMQLATRAEARGLPLRFRHLAVAVDDAEQ